MLNYEDLDRPRVELQNKYKHIGSHAAPMCNT